MKEKLTYSVIYLTYCEYGEFRITTNIKESIRGYLNWLTDNGTSNTTSDALKDFHDLDKSYEYIVKEYVYYQKDYKTFKGAEKHLQLLESKLDKTLYPQYYNCDGLLEYLDLITY